VICDHIGWKSCKLIARTISPAPPLFVAKRRSTYSQGNIGKFWGVKRWGREKVACWRTIAAISLKRVKTEEKLLWTAYKNPPTLFLAVPSPTPYGLPFLEIGVCNLATPLISGTRKATDFKFGGYIYRANPNKSLLRFWRKGSVGVSKDCPNFLGTPYYLKSG